MVERIRNLDAANSGGARHTGNSYIGIHQDCFEKPDKSRLATAIAAMHDTQSGNVVERYVFKNTRLIHVNFVQSHRLLLLIDFKSPAEAEAFSRLAKCSGNRVRTCCFRSAVTSEAGDNLR